MERQAIHYRYSEGKRTFAKSDVNPVVIDGFSGESVPKMPRKPRSFGEMILLSLYRTFQAP
jgi:hypothetical protein